ncbi:MAG: adenylate/guanylate cyclase domain-containing protein [Planctomycetota bacterium]
MPDEDIDQFLRPTRSALIASEFFSSSAHVPIIIGLATLCTRPVSMWPMVIPLLAGAFVQAWVIGGRVHRGLNPSFAANLIGVALFTVSQLVTNWNDLGNDALLPIYWGVSLIVAACQEFQPRMHAVWSEISVIIEHLARSMAIVAVYAVVVVSHTGLFGFVLVREHLYLVSATLLLGLALGMADVMHRRDRLRLGKVVIQLRTYSEMLLGRTMLNRAVGKDDQLKPRRTRRSVLFADIRGFTRWSEERNPEEVLLMLNGFYVAVEDTCARFRPAKTKHTADEVMMFFAEPIEAARAAMALREVAGSFLQPYGLHVGIGVHHGDVIEGLVGAARTKAYDILGDTVNTAKRICDHAQPGQIMVSFTFYEAGRGRVQVGGDRAFQAKGKTAAVLVAELIGLSDTTERIVKKPSP